MPKKTTPYISIITPVYACEKCLELLYQRIHESLIDISDEWELIMVNDGSPDKSWKSIEHLAKQDNRVKGICLSRNFGQHYAITAGLDYCQGEWVVVLDCDLQDKPEMIPRLYRKAMEGWDVVVGRRSQRRDNALKKLFSRIFYRFFNYLTETKINHEIGNFGIYSKEVIKNVNRFREQNRSFGLFVIWLGFKRIEIEVEHDYRKEGKSSYTFVRMVKLAMDSIISHSNKPLKLTVKLGFFLSIFSVLYSTWLVVRYFMWGIPVTGWTSLMVSLFFLTGLIVGTIGMSSLYIGKIFDESKQRPLYVVSKTTFKGDV